MVGAGAAGGAGGEGSEVFLLLEGGAAGWGEAAAGVAALWGGVREPWLVRALLHYHARTGSPRAIALLARAPPDPHARHLLDALADQLQHAPTRRAALAALAPLVARRPSWLPRLLLPAHAHPLPRELLRAARSERDPLALLHALLALAVLVPCAPALAAPHWPELADALLRPAALHPPPPPHTAAHLALAQLALFHALYATHPCTLIETLRAELAGATAGTREALARALQPLLASVRLHPALVTGSRAREADAARRLEEHDIVAETRRLALHSHTPTPRGGERDAPPAPPRTPRTPLLAPLTAPTPTLRPGTEPWFPLAERCTASAGAGADSTPHTPLPLPVPGDADVTEPPEAAVEATPENTPAKETRAAFRFPSDSSVVRAIGRRAVSARAASPPPRKDTSPPAAVLEGRLARVVADRRALDSPVVFAAGGGVPPAGALRVEPRPAPALPPLTPLPPAPATLEDSEVLALTTRWTDLDGAPPPRLEDPRRLHAPSLSTPRRSRPPRRSTSLAPRGARTASAACQTIDTWPEPYEFLIADFYRNIPEDNQQQAEGGGESSQPCERLDAYLSALYNGVMPVGCGGNELSEQLALTHAQLMYERWRREAHAERNRRLLGRCRQARAVELHNAALHDRLHALALECDELRARLAASRTSVPSHCADEDEDERFMRLGAALQEERAKRARAEARAHESERARAEAVAELQRAKGEAFESQRHVEALARAALHAERRGEHVKRLRCELLVLAEREARLSAALRTPETSSQPAQPSPLERSLRAALTRAESEVGAAQARAEAATARAHELETALAAREQALAEMRRAARAHADENEARLQALQQRYDTLLRVLRAAEGRHLELLAAAAQPRAPRAPPPPPPHEKTEADADVPDDS